MSASGRSAADYPISLTRGGRLGRFELPAFRRGGLVRGPGTGTSDSIPTLVPEGTYIVRAAALQRSGALSRLYHMLTLAGMMGPRPSARERMVPVRLSNGEFAVPPEVVRHREFRLEIERMNRGLATPRIRPAYGFAEGGLAAFTASVSGAMGAGGEAGQAGSPGAPGPAGSATVELQLADGLIARRIESLLQSPAGTRLIVKAASRAPRSMNAALRR